MIFGFGNENAFVRASLESRGRVVRRSEDVMVKGRGGDDGGRSGIPVVVGLLIGEEALGEGVDILDG